MSLLEEGVIAEKVRKNELGKNGLLYHTCRELKNEEGEKTGEIRVLALKSDGIARTEYVCPKCSNHGFVEKEWKRPFSAKCEKCGNRMKVPRIKDKVKRERKKT